jgi:O-antigen ligase
LDLDKTAYTIFLITLIVSPLLFGAVHTYAYTFMSLGVFTGSIFIVLKNIRKDVQSDVYKYYFLKTNLNFVFFALFIFLMFQVIPLPGFLLDLLSSEAMRVGKKSLPASSALGSGIPIRSWFSLSPYYYPVRMSIIRWTVYALFFLGLTQVMTTKKRIEVTIFLILLTGCFEALYGMAETYSGSGHIWWYKKVENIKDATGTYINRNHLAGLLELCLLLAAAYAAALSGRKRETVSDNKPGLRVKLLRYLSGEQRFNKRTFILFCGATIGMGLIFSASRGGMVSAAGALLCMSLMFILRKDHRRKGLIIFFLFIITSIYALQIGVEYPVGRFRNIDDSYESRARKSRKAMDMFKDYKVTGVGVGNFQYAYPKYQAAQDKNSFIEHAHNDWAQYLAEAGITGFCLLLVGILYHGYQTVRLWRKRTDSFSICLGVVPLAAMSAMAIHSASDFNLHIPANCLMLAAIMAIGHSALHLERHHGSDLTSCRYHIIPLPYRGMAALLLLTGLIIWNGWWTIRHFMAEAYCNTIPNSTFNRDQNPPLEEIKKAINWDRWNAEYWYKLNLELKRVQGEESRQADGRKRHMEIIKALEEAVRLNPQNAVYHLMLGWELCYQWREHDYHEKWLPSADISMERAGYFAGEWNPYLHIQLGNYWAYRSKTIHTSRPEWETAWNKARFHYKKAQSLESGEHVADTIVRYVWKYYPDKEIVRDVLLVDNQNLLEEM